MATNCHIFLILLIINFCQNSNVPYISTYRTSLPCAKHSCFSRGKNVFWKPTNVSLKQGEMEKTPPWSCTSVYVAVEEWRQGKVKCTPWQEKPRNIPEEKSNHQPRTHLMLRNLKCFVFCQGKMFFNQCTVEYWGTAEAHRCRRSLKLTENPFWILQLCF